MRLDMDGKVIFDDQISDLMDTLLDVRGLAMLYRMEKGRYWVRAAGDSGLAAGLKRLTGEQLSLIEAVVFGRRSYYEVMKGFGMSDEEMAGAVEELRRILGREV